MVGGMIDWWFADNLKAPKDEREVYLYTDDVAVARDLRNKNFRQVGRYYTVKSSRSTAWQFRLLYTDLQDEGLVGKVA